MVATLRTLPLIALLALPLAARLPLVTVLRPVPVGDVLLDPHASLPLADDGVGADPVIARCDLQLRLLDHVGVGAVDAAFAPEPHVMAPCLAVGPTGPAPQ